MPCFCLTTQLHGSQYELPQMYSKPVASYTSALACASTLSMLLDDLGSKEVFAALQAS